MNYFHYVDNKLWCEEVPVFEVAKAVGTPFLSLQPQDAEETFQGF